MRKALIVLTVVIVVVLIAFLNIKFGKIAENVKPEVLNISTFQATIAWLSTGKYVGRVNYMPANSEVGPMSATESFGGSTRHEVVLTGLRPSTRYTYWIGDSKSRYQFQTQPASNNPFSFLIVWGDISEKIVQLMRTDSGEFILSIMPSTDKSKNDCFAQIRPFVPVYNIMGIDSPFLDAIGEKHQQDSNNLWKLDWGGLRMIFTGAQAGLEKIAGLLDAPSAHTIGIISSSKENKLQSILVEHNKQHPANPVSFVMIIESTQNDEEVDGIHYLSIDTAKSPGAIRVDVDTESIRAVFIDQNREVALKQPPLKQKRTCEECRRLADKGAYEESIKAYQEFIETHKGNYQIDDAYFAIADIYDSKLFEFEKALAWYRRLQNEYPDGTLSSLANQRIKYISAYQDYDYKPLAQFERIKAIEFARKKDQPTERDKILSEVSGLISQYPDSNLAPVMQHWLANQYRQYDADKAVAAYMTLRKNYPEHGESHETMIEIGETYYDAGRFKEARNAYVEALKELPAMSDTIKAQISRSNRNIRRVKLAYISWSIITIIGLISLRKRQPGIQKFIWSAAVFVLLLAVLSFFAWLIHEQFNSVREMVFIVISFSAVGALSSFVSLKISNSIRGKGILSPLIAVIAGGAFYLAGIFLAIYYIYVHYLIVVKL